MLQHQIPQCHQPRARGGMGGPPVTLVGVPHQVLLGPLYWLLPCMPTKTWLLTGPDGMDLRNSQEGDWVPAIPELVAKPGWSLIAHGPLKKIQCSVPGCCQQASAEFSVLGVAVPQQEQATQLSSRAHAAGPSLRQPSPFAEARCQIPICLLAAMQHPALKPRQISSRVLLLTLLRWLGTLGHLNPLTHLRPSCLQPMEKTPPHRHRVLLSSGFYKGKDSILLDGICKAHWAKWV